MRCSSVLAMAIAWQTSPVPAGFVSRSSQYPAPAVVSAALARAVADREALGARALERCATHFTLEVVGARWNELLHEVAAGPS